MKTKLRLHKETLRDLTHRELRSVIGGATEVGGQGCDSLVTGDDPSLDWHECYPEPGSSPCNNPSEVAC